MQTVSLFAPLKVLKEYSLAHAPYCFPPFPLGEKRMSLKMVWWTEAARKQVLFLYLFSPSPLLPRHFLKGQGQEQVFKVLFQKTPSSRFFFLNVGFHMLYKEKNYIFTPRPLINTLEYFRILFRLCQTIRPLSLIPRYAA
jgi:hypothetical protein